MPVLHCLKIDDDTTESCIIDLSQVKKVDCKYSVSTYGVKDTKKNEMAIHFMNDGNSSEFEIEDDSDAKLIFRVFGDDSKCKLETANMPDIEKYMIEYMIARNVYEEVPVESEEVETVSQD